MRNDRWEASIVPHGTLRGNPFTKSLVIGTESFGLAIKFDWCPVCVLVDHRDDEGSVVVGRTVAGEFTDIVYDVVDDFARAAMA